MIYAAFCLVRSCLPTVVNLQLRLFGPRRIKEKACPETSALGRERDAWRGMGSAALGTSTVSGASLGARKLLKTKSAQGPDFVKSRGFKVTPAQRNPLSPTPRSGYGAPRPDPGPGPTTAWAWEAAGDRGISHLGANRLPTARLPRVTPRTMTPGRPAIAPALGPPGFSPACDVCGGFSELGASGEAKEHSRKLG